MKAAPLASNHPHIATITAEGRGRLRIRPVDVFGLLKLQLEAAKGDRDAVRLMPAVMATVLAVCNPPPGQLPTCASCGGSIGMYRRYHIGVIHAAVAAPEAALTF